MVKECVLLYKNGSGIITTTTTKVESKIRFDSIPDALADFGMFMVLPRYTRCSQTYVQIYYYISPRKICFSCR